MAADLSVVIPALDASTTIEAAIASVLAVEPDADIVVVDDGSTDDTAAIATAVSSNVRVGRNLTTRGVAASRNHGLLIADRPIIGFVDADDVWLPAAGSRLTTLREEPEVDLVVGLTRILANGEVVAEQSLMPFVGSVLIRRSALIRVGAFDEDLQRGEDLDWFHRARATVAPRQLDEATYEYRMHPGSLAASASDRREGLMQGTARALARNRGRTGPPRIRTVSAIMAVHDGMRYLDAALDSIQAQTRPVDEILVVDQGSTDGTRERLAERGAEDPRIQVFDPQWPTVAGMYNTAIAQAKGDMICWLAHDDEWAPGAVEAYVRCLDGPPAADLAHGLIHYFTDDGTTLPPSARAELVDTVAPTPIPEGRAVRRSLLHAVGGHRPAVAPSDDADWLARALDAGVQNVTAQEVVVHKRIHGAAITFQATPRVHDGLLNALHASIQRKRAAR